MELGQGSAEERESMDSGQQGVMMTEAVDSMHDDRRVCLKPTTISVSM